MTIPPKNASVTVNLIGATVKYWSGHPRVAKDAKVVHVWERLGNVPSVDLDVPAGIGVLSENGTVRVAFIPHVSSVGQAERFWTLLAPLADERAICKEDLSDAL